MPKFTSTNGRVWHVELTVSQIERVRIRCEVDCYGLIDDDFSSLLRLLRKEETGPGHLLELLRDPQSAVAQFVAVLTVVCEVQMLAQNIDEFDFGIALAGALPAAREAFCDAVIDFFSGDPTKEPPKDAPKLSSLSGADWEQEAWRLAGILGIHPGPFKLRELRRMALGRMRHEWQMTSTMTAELINIQLGKDARPLPHDFLNPFKDLEAKISRETEAPGVDPLAAQMLKAAFVHNEGRGPGGSLGGGR